MSLQASTNGVTTSVGVHPKQVLSQHLVLKVFHNKNHILVSCILCIILKIGKVTQRESRQTKSTIEVCVREIDLWMLVNKLKLKCNKTEILVFSSSYCPRPALNNLVIASETVDCSTIARNIGVIFNNSLSVLPHVTAVCKSSFFLLRNIFKIRKFLSYDACKILIHAFITSRIDHCNLLRYGQPKCILQRLQSVLNSAARLIHFSSR